MWLLNTSLVKLDPANLHVSPTLTSIDTYVTKGEKKESEFSTTVMSIHVAVHWPETVIHTIH